jgi:uncharacterized protein YfaS (alpha-2-macroglobulin family)
MENGRRRDLILLSGLIAVVVIMAGVSLAIGHLAKGRDDASIGVFDVVVDKHARRYVDVVFDHPIGVAAPGVIIDPPPATIEPDTAGVWRWRAMNVLRFEPAGGLTIAQTYTIHLKTQRLVGATERFRGDGDLAVTIDGLMVEKVVTTEEGTGDRKSVVISGQIVFNYAVDPAMVITHAYLLDGERRQPIELMDGGGTALVTSFRTQPLVKGEDERVVKLVIEKGLAEHNRGARLEADYVHPIRLGSSNHLAVRTVEPQSGETQSTLRIGLSSTVNADVAANFLTITPAAKFHLAAQGNDLFLTGAFTPGTQYTLTLAKGLPAADDALLRSDYTTTATFPDLTPKLDFQSEGTFLSAAGYKTLAVESTNVEEASVSIDRVYRNNIFYELAGDFWYPYEGGSDDDDEYDGSWADNDGELRVSSVSHTMGDPIVRKKFRLAGTKNRKHLTTIQLEPLINEQEPGLYRVVLSGRGGVGDKTRWILITDLGIVAKRGTDTLLVWVSSFQDLSAVADANVSLVSDQNQLLASGRTDGRGLWVIHDFAKVTKGGKKHPFLVRVEKGSDQSFLVFGKTEVDVSPFDVAGDRLKKDGYSAFVYGERDIYRPGESVEGVALLRTAALEVPPSMPLIVKHHDSEGERETFRINAGEGGIAPFTLKLPAYARTGRHRLDVIAGSDVVGSYNFQVEEFVPDRIKVAITPAKPFASAGDGLQYAVGSAYLFGPPAANLPVETRVRLVPSGFAPAGFESFTFTNGDRKFDARELGNESATLDEKGAHAFNIEVPRGLQPPLALDAIVTARVQEQGGRGVAAVAHIPVHAWPSYVGVRRLGGEEHYPEPGKPVAFEWVSVGVDGKEKPSGALRAELFEDEWHTVLRKTSTGGYGYESTRESRLVKTLTIAAGSARGTVSFVPVAYRTYRVVVGDPITGASSSLEFSAGGWGYSPWAMKNPGRLQLELDKDEYAPGQEATLQVKAPFSGKLLLTIEREEVEYAAVEMLAGNTATIKLPVTAGLRPNAYVTATLVRAAKDLEPGEAGRAFGAVSLNVDREANRLRPIVKAPADLRSNSKLTVEVTTEPAAVVTVAAVDEGILQLIAQKTPEPHAYFYRKLALGVSTNDIFAELLPEVKPKGRGIAGGGENLEGAGQYVRADSIRRAKPVAYWSGVLHADGQGRVRTSFAIPDFQGGVRVMAVAGKGRRFGNGEAMTKVHDPIVLLPTYPRFLNVRDQLSLPVTVRNDSGRQGRMTVTLRCGSVGSAIPTVIPSAARDLNRRHGGGDPSLALGMTGTGAGPAVTLAADVPNGGERTLFFPLQAPSLPGDLTINITAAGNGQTAKSSATVPVRWDAPLESVEDAGRFNEPAALFRNETVAQFVPGSVERTLVVSPLPLVQFRGKLTYLLHYPYGCVEQTTSSVFPLVYFGDLAQLLDPDAFRDNDSVAMVAAGIRRLGTMQTVNGGFAMWPYGSNTEPWNSVYATHFLVEAKRAGHAVPQPTLDRALGYVATDARAKNDYDTYELQRVVYALYVLARAGKADLGTMDYLREHQLGRMHPESRALLAAAYAATGNARMLDVLLGRIADVDEVQRTTGGTLDSTTRDRALLLLALLDVNPADGRVPALVERLTRDVHDAYWSTQESSLALVALGQLARQQHELTPYSGTVFVDGKPFGTFEAKTKTFPHIRGENIKVVMSGKYASGAAYYALSTRGIRTSASFHPESSGIRVTRELLTRDGQPLDAAGPRQGDLVVCKITVSSTNGAMNNVVVQNLIPSGLEVENPRLKSSETFTWISGEMSAATNVDIRDDQTIYFVELPASGTLTFYTLLRAVTPGVYPLPPLLAEAMYARRNHAVGERGGLVVRQR